MVSIKFCLQKNFKKFFKKLENIVTALPLNEIRDFSIGSGSFAQNAKTFTRSHSPLGREKVALGDAGGQTEGFLSSLGLQIARHSGHRAHVQGFRLGTENFYEFIAKKVMLRTCRGPLSSYDCKFVSKRYLID